MIALAAHAGFNLALVHRSLLPVDGRSEVLLSPPHHAPALHSVTALVAIGKAALLLLLAPDRLSLDPSVLSLRTIQALT